MEGIRSLVQSGEEEENKQQKKGLTWLREMEGIRSLQSQEGGTVCEYYGEL
jgi:hypothetical protein